MIQIIFEYKSFVGVILKEKNQSPKVMSQKKKSIVNENRWNHRELDFKSYGREGGVASFGSLCLSLFSFMVDFCSWLNAFGDSFFCF